MMGKHRTGGPAISDPRAEKFACMGLAEAAVRDGTAGIDRMPGLEARTAGRKKQALTKSRVARTLPGLRGLTRSVGYSRNRLQPEPT